MKVLCVAGVFWAQCLLGQSLHPVSIPIQSAMLVTERFSDPINCFQHPAAFAQQKSIAGFVFTESHYGLRELNTVSAAIVFPLHQSGFGVLMSSRGMEGFHEGRVSLGYARQLGKLSLGAQFNYTSINAVGYGTSAVVSAGASICWWVSNKLMVGVSIMDPGRPEFNKSLERLAWIYKMGLGYELSEKVLVAVALKKIQQQKASLEFDLIYKLLEHFYFRAGYLTESSGPYITAGWSWKSFRIEACSKYHIQLGFTPGVLLLFSLQKKSP
jgi:hypothetical protein